MKFLGSFEDLQTKLGSLAEKGSWNQLNPNQYQYKSNDGAILNWYPSTGTINIQGRHVGDFESDVADLLSSSAESAVDEEEEKLGGEKIKNESDLGSEERQDDVHYQLQDIYSGSEIILGLVGAVGTDLDQAIRILEERLKAFSYSSEVIRISRDVIPSISSFDSNTNDNYARINGLMTQGNYLREHSGDNSILALAASAKINQYRNEKSSSEDGSLKPVKNKAFIVSSLKHPAEVQRLRKIYSSGFLLVGVYSNGRRRSEYLTKDKRIGEDQAQKLMARDSDESEPYGQHTRDTFHLSDFFVNYDGDSDKFKNELWRVLDLVFGKPFVTPTFDEFAMFMAFSAALRSADLSRQVGAVIAKNNDIVSTGANDVPKYGGGLYWPEYNEEEKTIDDKEDGRDYKRGFDSNAQEKRAIISDILSNLPDDKRDEFEGYLRNSRIKDITEYGRVVHAEMEAVLACARANISTDGSTIYCTTFPCHNCAKHIIAAGIKRVVYVEPYPKSKAIDFHSDSISLEGGDEDNVIFEPFVGVGPRSFFNYFSTNLGSGYPIKRKKSNGEVVEWKEEDAEVRMQMLPTSYIERETFASSILKDYLEAIDE